MKIKKH